jgi:predicted Zn finger-like uncharacterized protein
MLIVCPNCATSYMIDRASLGTAGRSVRCARCQTTWFADGQAGGGKRAAEVSAQVDSAVAAARSSPRQPPPVHAPSIMDKPPSAEEAVRAREADQSAEPDTSAIRAAPATPEITAPAIDAAASEPELAAPAASAEAAEPAAEEPFSVADAPPLVPPAQPAPLAEPTPAEIEAEAVDGFAARRERLYARRTRSLRSSRWTALILLLFAFNVAVIGSRNEVVRYLPQTASLFAAIGLPVNLRHLKFEDVRIARDNADGKGALIVEGTIVSTSSQPIKVPRLRFAARNAAGQEVYSWTARPDRSVLEPGGKLDFHSRIASPPADAVNVMVRFFTPEDAEAGEK